MKMTVWTFSLLTFLALAGAASAAECQDWKTRHPEWIFCDDFETTAALVGTGRYFEVERQSVLMSGYLGSIGFALPAALGAWAAVGGERQIVAVAGDGGFGQYAMELTTAVRHDMDLTVVVLDNSELGKISKEQRAAEYDVWQTSLHNPDFAAYAESFGALGLRASTPDELRERLDEGFASSRPTVVHLAAGPMPDPWPHFLLGRARG